MLEPELQMQIDELCNANTKGYPNEKEMFDIYTWVDSLEFSRPKKNITRDFSDGVLAAELIAHYIPQMVDIRQYTTALSKKNKENNWNHLNLKVLQKQLGIKIEKSIMQDIMDCKPGAIEKFLFDLRPFIARRNRTILDYKRGGSKSVTSFFGSEGIPNNQGKNKLAEPKLTPLPPSRPPLSLKPIEKKPVEEAKKISSSEHISKRGTIAQLQKTQSKKSLEIKPQILPLKKGNNDNGDVKYTHLNSKTAKSKPLHGKKGKNSPQVQPEKAVKKDEGEVWILESLESLSNVNLSPVAFNTNPTFFASQEYSLSGKISRNPIDFDKIRNAEQTMSNMKLHTFGLV